MAAEKISTIELLFFCICGQARTFTEKGGWVAAYKDRNIPLIMGHGKTQLEALTQCYQRVTETLRHHTGGIESHDDFRASRPVSPSRLG